MTARRHAQLGIALAVVLSLGLTACANHSNHSIVNAHGDEARRIAGIWWLMFSLAAGVYVIVAGLIVYAMMRGRRRSPEEGRAGRLNESAFIWWGGVAIPVVILAVLAVATVSAAADLRKPAKDALKIDVVGKRWWWAVSYPDRGITTANEIHLPVGQPIELRLTSDNVIHSFWVPELAGKLDNVPGQTNTLRFTAERAGTFRGQCAEYCGLEHARMSFLVIADPPDVFERWAAREARPTSTPVSDAAARGELVFQREPCAGCHTIRGTGAHGIYGPDLSDVGSRTTIGSVTASNTTANLSRWVTDAPSIKPGVLMPPIPLSPADRDDLVAYLQSLK